MLNSSQDAAAPVELREAVEELTAAVKSEVTLGGRITERPALWLLGGFGVGLLLALRR